MSFPIDPSTKGFWVDPSSPLLPWVAYRDPRAEEGLDRASTICAYWSSLRRFICGFFAKS